MRFAIALIVSSVWCALTVLVIRHHRRTSNPFRKTTLGEIYMDFLKEMPRLVHPRRQLLLLLGLTAMFCSFYPVLLVTGVRGGGGQALFLIGGLIALVGAGVNIVLIVLSHANFMLGSSAQCHEETALTWLLPLSQAMIALTSVAIGFSAGWVAGISRFIIG